MGKREFIVREGSLQEQFLGSRNKIQFYGGGYGNGKSSCACVKAINIMKDYPGSNGAVLRASLPKLKETTMKEFFKWLPENWVQAFNKADRSLILKNGSQATFTYLSQQGKGDSTTSNVLSATFDWILVDQFEDPEFSYKDFVDLLGRLRGTAEYVGDDPTMPRSGPRWLFFLTNPTRNWIYQKIIKPIHMFKKSGVIHEDLLYDKGVYAKTGEVKLIIDIVEGSTYDNKDNLPEDFIATLENTYTGQMRARFLEGEWAGYEGLVYPDFDLGINVVPHSDMVGLLNQLNGRWNFKFIEGYDYGLAAPSCYLLSFMDGAGNIHIIDGFYKKETTPEDQASLIKSIRARYGVENRHDVKADPAIFRRGAGNTISDAFWNAGIYMSRGDNNILSGIQKVTSYMKNVSAHVNPYTKDFPSPHLYVSDTLQFFINEISGYYWKKDSSGTAYEDMPTDKDDHAMDALKYMLTDEAEVATILTNTRESLQERLSKWSELDDAKPNKEPWRV